MWVKKAIRCRAQPTMAFGKLSVYSFWWQLHFTAKGESMFIIICLQRDYDDEAMKGGCFVHLSSISLFHA